MRRFLLLLGRASRLRCPACGGGPIFASWFDMRASCPSCGLRLEREEGYFLGAMLFNVIAAEVLFVVAFAAVLIRTWPSPPWTLLTYAAAVGVVLFPVALYPFSRTVWLAFDLFFQPPGEGEHEAPRSSSADGGRAGG
jgi:uncharacterized protein (DUF983 family)